MKTPADRFSELELARHIADAYGNHAIDEFIAGRITRRDLLRYASVIGLSLVGGGVLNAPRARAQGAPSPANQTIRVAHLTPAGAVDPLTVTDAASLALLNQTGEFLIDDDGEKLVLKPALALSWKPNDKGDVWTFKLRANVKFHDGQAFAAKDVVATFDRLADPASGSAALSVLKGVLSKGGAKVVDDHTVAFHLDAPNGNFPYYVSSD
ncbi:MAG TPA: ABC transporter substrate-binding protein, partial [Paraburkholderia sp.]|nr:ABC transporter substrate-binding protein [Paraburkholderia sp.]